MKKKKRKQRLGPILHKALEDTGEIGFDAGALASSIWSQLTIWNRRVLGLAELARRLKMAAANRNAEAEKAERSSQIELPFNLPNAVPMDLDGGRIRYTRSLLEAEYKRAGEVRANQIKADQASLKEWRDGEAAAKPYWKLHPDWTFGQCMDALVADRRRATA